MGLGSRVQDLRFRVSGLELRVSGHFRDSLWNEKPQGGLLCGVVHLFRRVASIFLQHSSCFGAQGKAPSFLCR